MMTVPLFLIYSHQIVLPQLHGIQLEDGFSACLKIGSSQTPNYSEAIFQKMLVFVFYCCYNKLAQTQGLKIQVYYLIVLQLRSSVQMLLGYDQGVGRAGFSSGGSRGEFIPLPFPAFRGYPHLLAPGHLLQSSMPASCISLTLLHASL